MRDSCLECVLKHLGAAAVYIEEYNFGYPNYFGYVYGHLDHAASEAATKYPDLAWAIREHRIKWAASRRSSHPHKIPFEAMFGFIDVLEVIGEDGGDMEIPDEVYAGIDKGPDGYVFSMDTRPK